MEAGNTRNVSGYLIAFANMVLFLLSLIFIILKLSFLFSDTAQVVNTGFYYIFISICILSLLTSASWLFLMTKSRRSYRIAHIISLLILVATTLFVLIEVFSEKSKNHLANWNIEWNRISFFVRGRIQDTRQCCGFYDYADRLQEPCTKYFEQLGCGELISAEIEEEYSNFVILIIILMSSQLIAFVLEVVDFIKRSKDKKQESIQSDFWQRQ